jgi:hypothetical protein
MRIVGHANVQRNIFFFPKFKYLPSRSDKEKQRATETYAGRDIGWPQQSYAAAFWQ